MDKWICGICGREVAEKPKRNAVCNSDGCKGRFHHYRQCKCGEWFRCKDDKQKYCSINCISRAKRITVKCSNCGKELIKKESEIKNNKNTFCDKKCKLEFYEGEKIQRECDTCGRTFEIYKSTLIHSNASGRFCCRKCYDEYQKTITGEKNHRYKSKVVACAMCGKDVIANPYRIKTNKNIFCSIKCYREYFHNYVEGENNAHWKGGHSKYRGNFERVKRKHFKKIQFCAICGTTKKINIHHIIPYRMTQDNSLENLIPLCASHHKKIEHITQPIYDWDDKEKAKECLNVILRAKQKTVQIAVKKFLTERNNHDKQNFCNAEIERNKSISEQSTN